MRRLLASLIAAMLAVTDAAGAEPHPRQQALVLLRVLVYDRALKARAGPAVRVAVLYRPGHAGSEHQRDRLAGELEEIARTAVAAGLPIQVLTLPYLPGAELGIRLREQRVAALFACDGLEKEAAAIARAARASRVLTLSASRRMVEEGLAVAIVDRGDRAGLVVSPRSAAEQGADLDSALLTLAELVNGGMRADRP